MSLKERVRVLVKTYLDFILVEGVEHKEDDYVAIKNWLISRLIFPATGYTTRLT